MVLHNPTYAELGLLTFLIEHAENCSLGKDWPAELMVAEMEDGGMGSLRLYPEGRYANARIFGNRISDCRFKDEDGMEVIASLNLDQNGNLYELDIWKTNFEKLMRIPSDLHELRLVENKNV